MIPELQTSSNLPDVPISCLRFSSRSVRLRDGAARFGRRMPGPHDWLAAPLAFTRGCDRRGAGMGEDDASDVLADGAWHRLDAVFLDLLPAGLRAELLAARAECLANPIDARDAAHLQRLEADPYNPHIPRIQLENFNRLQRGKVVAESFATVWRRCDEMCRERLAAGDIATERMRRVDGVRVYSDFPSDAWQDCRLGYTSLIDDDWLAGIQVRLPDDSGKGVAEKVFIERFRIRRSTIGSEKSREPTTSNAIERAEPVRPVPSKAAKKPSGRKTTLAGQAADKFADKWLRENGEDLAEYHGKQAKCIKWIRDRILKIKIGPGEQPLELSDSRLKEVVGLASARIAAEKAGN